MKAGQRRQMGLLFILALAVRVLTAWPLRQPGYTDAYYYAIGAQQLYRGQGFNEPFIWNYLDPPAGVPHAGYQYWMPLAAMLGGLGMTLLGNSFRAMQAPFVLLSALLPLVAYAIAWDLTAKSRYALLAGLLAVFPGFYAHVLVLPDNFAPFALAGSVCLWSAGRGLRGAGDVAGRGWQPAWFGLAGLAAGFGHLARADGLLLVGVVLVAAAIPGRLPADHSKIGTRNLASLAMVVGGYVLVMGPWFIRNWRVFGTPLAGAGLQTLFLTNYDDVFAYGRPPTLASYLAWGWGPILRSKAEALVLNLQRLWLENLLVFLLPFTALGLWRLRRDRLLWPFFLYLPLLFLAMTIAFTFPGMRGGLFHSGGALLPFFFAAAGPGLEIALQWAARRIHGWQARKAWPAFSAGMVGLAIVLTVFALGRAGVLTGGWNEHGQGHSQIGNWLAGQGAAAAIVMAGDAPAFAWHTGHRAIAIPNEPLDTILAVAQHYGARYLVLDSARPRTTDALYAGKATVPGLSLRYTTGANGESWQVYEVAH
jgi:hypothetical protein